MTTIDPSASLAAAVRAQLAGVRERRASRAASGGERGERAAGGPRTVSRAMAERIASIAPEEADRSRKAVRIYLEAELAREFGAGLVNDPEFPTLLDAVQEQMQGDAQMAAAVEALGRLLLQNRSLGPR